MPTEIDVTLEDLNNKAFVTNYVRNLVYPQFQLGRFMPEKRFDGLVWSWNLDNGYQEPAINYRAWDTEVPIGKRPGVSRASQEMQPLGKKKLVTEEHRLREAAIDAGDWSGLIQGSLQDLENLTQGVHSRWELDRAALLSTGKFNVAGYDTGTRKEFTIEIDYQIPSGNKITASPLWSSISTADPLLDITNAVKVYKAANKGLRPGRMLISETILGYLLQNEAIRSILYYGAPNSAPSVLTEQIVRAEFAARGLPPFEVIDEQVTDSDGTYGDVLPQNKVIFLPPDDVPAGFTVHGRTAESLGMIQEGIIVRTDAAGIVASSWDSVGDPPQRWNKVSAVGMPVITEASRLLILTVAA